MIEQGSREQARRRDAMYSFQRHFYDLTRKPYLLGRDVVIRGLNLPNGGTVLEIGCGTGRNLACIARAYPTARCFGLDVSEEMLKTARAKLAREGLGGQVKLAASDANSFDPAALFGVQKFDRVVISYALSMIEEWEAVLEASVKLLSPTGTLYVVDFGDQSGLPGWFRKALLAWLVRFSVTPRDELADQIASTAWTNGYGYNFRNIYKGYAAVAEITAR